MTSCVEESLLNDATAAGVNGGPTMPANIVAGFSGSDSPVLSIDDCLKVRKWWCFVLSSIFTFLAGLLIVLLWRAFAFLCCRKEPEFAPGDPKQKEQKAARQGKEFEGTFMTEAKDWAGELISGQTTTGRILVSIIIIRVRSILFLLLCTRPS
ncbi:hypothetical protein TKK_0017209 [Trichogramma kaykai]